MRRLNAGSRRLSKRSLSPRTRGRRSVIVPLLEAKPPRLPEAVAVADRRVDRGTPLIPTTGEQLVDFRFQHLLQELLHAVPRERFERLPGWACSGVGSARGS